MFFARGHGWLKMPGGLAQSGLLLPATGTNKTEAAPAGPQTVEIESDDYEIRTNAAFFRNHVRVSEHAGDQIKGRMNCGRMSLAFAGTNELQQLVADQDVVIQQAEAEMRSGHAVYTAATSTLEMTQKPSWRAGLREGKGDRITVNSQRNEMAVLGNALMRLPANELSQASLAGPELQTTQNPTHAGHSPRFSPRNIISALRKPASAAAFILLILR